MVIDAVIFNGEIEMLEFRMKILGPVVDRFIVVEADKTFQHKARKRSLVSEGTMNSLGVPRYNPEKVYAGYASMCGDDPWENERQQRDEILNCCRWMCKDDDLIIMGDVDEIPSREAVESQRLSCHLPKTFSLHSFYYNLRCMWPDKMLGSTLSTVGEMRKMSPRGMRHIRNQFPKIDNSGWHLSYFGGTAQIQEKLRSFSHTEYNKPEFLDAEHLEHCQATGIDLLKRGNVSSNPGKDFFPDYFIEAAPKEWF